MQDQSLYSRLVKTGCSLKKFVVLITLNLRCNPILEAKLFTGVLLGFWLFNISYLIMSLENPVRRNVLGGLCTLLFYEGMKLHLG